jgi:hypothetical protein
MDVKTMKKVIITAAGFAELSVGCHLQMNSYDTLILESHNDLKDSSDPLRRVLSILRKLRQVILPGLK